LLVDPGRGGERGDGPESGSMTRSPAKHPAAGGGLG